MVKQNLKLDITDADDGNSNPAVEPAVPAANTTPAQNPSPVANISPTEVGQAPAAEEIPIEVLIGDRETTQAARGTDIPTQDVSGILEIAGEGHGYLRPKFTPSDKDCYISQSQIRRFSLRPGDLIAGLGRP